MSHIVSEAAKTFGKSHHVSTSPRLHVSTSPRLHQLHIDHPPGLLEKQAYSVYHTQEDTVCTSEVYLRSIFIYTHSPRSL